MDYMKKSIMDRFHKLEGIKVEGSKIPPQPIELNANHLEVLAACEGGSTIWGFYEAKILREVQQHDNALIHIVDDIGELESILATTFNGAKRIPYFGAVLTKQGAKYLKENK
jgi:hypothetical protein